MCCQTILWPNKPPTISNLSGLNLIMSSKKSSFSSAAAWVWNFCPSSLPLVFHSLKMQSQLEWMKGRLVVTTKGGQVGMTKPLSCACYFEHPVVCIINKEWIHSYSKLNCFGNSNIVIGSKLCRTLATSLKSCWHRADICQQHGICDLDITRARVEIQDKRNEIYDLNSK